MQFKILKGENMKKSKENIQESQPDLTSEIINKPIHIYESYSQLIRLKIK